MILPRHPDDLDSVQQARTDVEGMEVAVGLLKKQLRTERRGNVSSRSELQVEHDVAASEHERLDAEVDRLKEAAKARKTEIDEWKSWYEKQTDDIAASLKTLQSEVAWRADDIATTEALIQTLMVDAFQARGRLEHARAQLIAFDVGAFDGPTTTDPRLVAAEAALAAAKERRQSLRRRPARRASAAAFQVDRTADGGYHFVLRAANGQVILASQRYSSRSSALKGVDAVRRNAHNPKRFERRKSRRKEPYFVLKGGNGQVIGQSEMYSSAAAMEQGIRSVRQNGPNGRLNDEAE